MSERAGFELPLLLLGAFRSLVDDLHVELARNGHPHARPLHGFALQAIGPDGVTISDLGRRLGVTKQAAAKTAAGLEGRGYVAREADPADARAIRLRRTARGEELLVLSAESFAGLRTRWVDELGARRLRELEDVLAAMSGARGGARLSDIPGWLGNPPACYASPLDEIVPDLGELP